MGIDLKIINDLWRAALVEAKDYKEDAQTVVPYTAILLAGTVLLKDKELAQRFVDEHWED